MEQIKAFGGPETAVWGASAKDVISFC